MRPLPLHGDIEVPASRPRLPILAKGFRPFFLLAAVHACAAVPLWLFVLKGAVAPNGYLVPAVWHAHEMIFGYTVAVLGGFLLTAVGNWTHRETAVGAPLLVLGGLWGAGRAAMTFTAAAFPPPLAAALDLAFLPALGIVIARPLVTARDRRNLFVLGILGALFAANAVVHFDALGIAFAGTGRRACIWSVDVIALVILVMGGRVFPMFTRNATGSQVRAIPIVEFAAIGGMTSLTLVDLFIPESGTANVLSALVAAVVLARAWSLFVRRVVRIPLLWVLHLGQVWVPIGLVLRVAAHFTPVVPSSLATHALTVGAIGALTLGMMARVSLGHTGRLLAAPRCMREAFIAVTAAAVVRVLVPLVFPRAYFAELILAGLLWSAAFLLFVAVYARILFSARSDGKPG